MEFSSGGATGKTIVPGEPLILRSGMPNMPHSGDSKVIVEVRYVYADKL
jgi:hypothetical protein